MPQPLAFATFALLLHTLARLSAAPDARVDLLTASDRIDLPQSQGKFDFLEIDRHAHRLLASHTEDGTLDVFDLHDRRLIGRVKTGAAQDVAVETSGQRYFVSVSDTPGIAVVDAHTLQMIDLIKTSGPVDSILWEPKRSRVYAAEDDGTKLWVIDPTSLKIIGTVEIPGAPEVMVYDPRKDKIYLNIKTKDLVAVINPETNQVIESWPTEPAKKPHGLALDTQTGHLFTAGANGKLVLLDTASGRALSSTEIAPKVDQIAYDEATKRIYCASSMGVFSVVHDDGAALTLLGEVSVGSSVKNVAVDPTDHRVWSTFSDGAQACAKSWILTTPETK